MLSGISGGFRFGVAPVQPRSIFRSEPVTTQRITNRAVDALKSNGSEFTVWDGAVAGFGVRVRPTGAKSYVVIYRAGAGRRAPVRGYTPLFSDLNGWS